ncbi:hypothetical protein N656DRAFT_619861 [Canariomyces notabilis]|uniref:Uncharacterized protein n=1 Tax=Canariomyces notabilis TaxID=2074819 RepID=A0AAN6TFE6_9PEZI|nr:hypothetical protein N656DRAFT_619861 [Canariomyces arenarius]
MSVLCLFSLLLLPISSTLLHAWQLGYGIMEWTNKKKFLLFPLCWVDDDDRNGIWSAVQYSRCWSKEQGASAGLAGVGIGIRVGLGSRLGLGKIMCLSLFYFML